MPSLIAFLRSAFLIVLSLTLLTSCTRTGSEEGSTAKAASKRQPAMVFLLRGGGAGVFSRGLDEISAQLTQAGIKNTVIAHRGWSEALDAIVKAKKSRRSPKVILIGHSLGANRVVDMATALKGHRKRVDFLVTFAATKQQVIPNNVRKATNYYFKTDGWGEAVTAGAGFNGRLKNVDVSGVEDVNHFNVEKHKRYQRQVINNVKRLAR